MQDKKPGMADPFVRWWVVFSIIAIGIGTTMIAGMGAFITASDNTGVSWATIVVFYAASLHFGLRVRQEGIAAETALTKYATDLCTSLGFLGTIVGLVMMVCNAFPSINISNAESIQRAIVAMAQGVGTALVTTLVGLVCAICLELQMAIVTLRWGKKCLVVPVRKF